LGNAERYFKAVSEWMKANQPEQMIDPPLLLLDYVYSSIGRSYR
jgi:hypothetical protein